MILHVRCEGLNRQLETDLVVALARAAVQMAVRLLFEPISTCPGDDPSRRRSAQKILPLVHGARLERREDIVLDEFLFQILDVELRRAGFECLFLESVQLRPLPHVAGDQRRPPQPS
jgi:hypothetical protein